MCGIYGYIGKVKPKLRKKVVSLIMELGAQTEIRGTDATGFYAKNDEYEYMEKHSVPASTFYLESDSFQEAILEGAFVFIGHNRHASVGDVRNDNAHPFMGENIVLVHNGTCSHAKNLLTADEAGRMEGDTDSEAIMLYLERVGLRSKCYASLNNFSIVSFDRVENVMYFARDENKPLVVADLRASLGIRVFASTIGILKTSLEKCKIELKADKVFSTRPDCLYEVRPEDGEVKRVLSFSLISSATSPEKKKNGESKRIPCATRPPINDKPYQQPDYLKYLSRSADSYHFSKSEDGKKSLLHRAMTVFGD